MKQVSQMKKHYTDSRDGTATLFERAITLPVIHQLVQTVDTTAPTIGVEQRDEPAHEVPAKSMRSQH